MIHTPFNFSKNIDHDLLNEYFELMRENPDNADQLILEHNPGRETEIQDIKKWVYYTVTESSIFHLLRNKYCLNII